MGIPAAYLALYRAAARSCPGLDWTLLAAVGQIESGHGRNDGPSSAGAVGPMQFRPRTFQAFAVDGNHDGRLDPMNPADAIFTAAHFLCSYGAGRPSGVDGALLHYNNAQWYVDLVLAAQARISATY
jgi:membrane-bound lytic murein transglycosylase B